MTCLLHKLLFHRVIMKVNMWQRLRSKIFALRMTEKCNSNIITFFFHFFLFATSTFFTFLLNASVFNFCGELKVILSAFKVYAYILFPLTLVAVICHL